MTLIMFIIIVLFVLYFIYLKKKTKLTDSLQRLTFNKSYHSFKKQSDMN